MALFLCYSVKEIHHLESYEVSDAGSQVGSKVIIDVPTCIQNYSWDCGLACASMVLRFVSHNCSHYANMPMHYTVIFKRCKNDIFLDEKFCYTVFLIFAQNIDCGYTLELPYFGGSNKVPTIYVLEQRQENNVYPCKPQFYYIKVGCSL